MARTITDKLHNNVWI